MTNALKHMIEVAVSQSELKPPFDEIQGAANAYGRYKQLTVGARSKVGTRARTPGVATNSTKRRNLAAAPEDDQTLVLADIFPVGVSSKRVLVGPAGLEPATYGLKVRSSAN